MFKIDPMAGWDLLREFWLAALWLRNMPQMLVSELLSEPHYRRFLGVARKGSRNWGRED